MAKVEPKANPQLYQNLVSNKEKDKMQQSKKQSQNFQSRKTSIEIWILFKEVQIMEDLSSLYRLFSWVWFAPAYLLST